MKKTKIKRNRIEMIKPNVDEHEIDNLDDCPANADWIKREGPYCPHCGGRRTFLQPADTVGLERYWCEMCLQFFYVPDGIRETINGN